MKKTFAMLLASVLLIAGTGMTSAQSRLYGPAFNLNDVELLDGPFKHAQDLNVKVLLEYDVDRLLAPFLLQAGLEPKGELFPNWEGLDGHVGGHYLSALAIHYASTGNEECLRRMNYMLDELDKCQRQSERGFVGGVPDSDRIWDEIHNGNTGIIGRYWVPWYNMHKTFAGLRDTWLYAGSEKGREMFLKLCDWGCWVTENLTQEQMESMMNTEFGGMNEVYADAYQMTMDQRYLDEAKKWTHHQLFDSMVGQVDNLDNKHANTQVPKVVGFARYYTVSKLPLQGDTWFDRLRVKLGRPSKAEVADTYDPSYLIASEFFWDRVANHRSVAFGGNSRREHFPQQSDYRSYVEEREGPESCNTNNMLKLTEDLFFENPRAEYADFYENAMYNHILSTQHPEHGGYVYFTPARPAHYRVYSQPNEGMWCCVGTGMENHGKYGEFIYAHYGDMLYVNLYVASKLNWKEHGVELVQETRFPDEDRSVITVNPEKPTVFVLKLRYPGWVREGEFSVTVNGNPVDITTGPQSYVTILRKWKKGDKVEIRMPMHYSTEQIEGVDDYIAIKYGPVLMGVKTGTEDMAGLVAGDGRWEHIAGGRLISALDAPYIIGDKKMIESKLASMELLPDADRFKTFQVKLFNGKYLDAELVPFYRIHDSRYSVYYLMMTSKQYQEHLDELAAIEAARLELDARTVDKVETGEQQPEVDHQMKVENSDKGNYEGEAWRDARNGGFFEYTMATGSSTELSLMVRYWGNESDFNRRFDILIDGEKIASETLFRKWNKAEFQNVSYEIPEKLLTGKSNVTVRFQSGEHTVAGGIFQIRLIKRL